MQHTLTFTLNKKKYVSKPFDFEAMRLINRAQNDPDKSGVIDYCIDAVDHLFEGTDATQDILNQLLGKRARMCSEVWKWYNEAWSEKNE
jgi:hypothetical protein|nr:MAG TPA: hypothetical protein [Caudoviricetes sp.]